MKRRTLIALIALSPLFGVACSGDDAAAIPTTTTAVTQVGLPDPALPIDINPIPYKPGELVALGNASIQIGVPTTSAENEFSFDVTVTSGSFDPFTISPEMFRVYTIDGKSYTAQFGNHTLQSEEVYKETFSVKIPTNSEPAMFVADLGSIGDRYFPGAWIFDPNFTPETAQG